MPGLLEIVFDCQDNLKTMAAISELSHSITPCTPMFQGPAVMLTASVLKRPSKQKRDFSDLQQVQKTLQRQGSTLRDLQYHCPQNNIVSPLNAPQLSLVRIRCSISPRCLPKVEQHRCSLVDCRWVKTRDEQNASRMNTKLRARCVEYKWTAEDQPQRDNQQQVDMLQWYPGLDEKEQKRVQAFFEMFNGKDRPAADDSSSENNGITVDERGHTSHDHEHTLAAEHRVSAHKEAFDEVVSSISPTYDGLDGDTNQQSIWSPRHTKVEDVLLGSNATTEAEPDITEPADLDENLEHFGNLPLAGHFDDVNGEHMHKNQDKVDAAWTAEFGEYAADFRATVRAASPSDGGLFSY